MTWPFKRTTIRRPSCRLQRKRVLFKIAKTRKVDWSNRPRLQSEPSYATRISRRNEFVGLSVAQAAAGPREKRKLAVAVVLCHEHSPCEL
mmetsp:Transcript_8720/g.24150  ORF Transcript_8720/g.24150 Transcript_8720/m.24150 type:complete len:90 (+) Transcript_8720:566-835(+)